VIFFCIVVIFQFQCITDQGQGQGTVDAFQCTLARPAVVVRPAPFSHHDTTTVRTTTTMRIIKHQYYYRHSSKLLANKKEKEGKNNNNLWNGIVELWDEIIEVSTYGPSERKMLKVQRERQKKLEDLDLDLDLGSVGGENQNALGVEMDMNDDRTWMDAFTAAKDNSDDESIDEDGETLDYDGYAMQDLLLSKWGISLDVDFQRIGPQIYCTILPQVGYGSPLKSRHDTELNYLMHLQGVVEILHKYDNLEGFISFVETTNKVPKRGTDSVPFRLNLSDKDIDRIMQT